MIFSFLLIHAAWLSNSLFAVCAHLYAFTDIFLHFMDVRRNCKVFSFCVKQAAIFHSLMCTCDMRIHIRVCWHTWLCVHTRMACLCVRVCNFHTSNFSNSTNFPLYVNTSIHYECFHAFLNVSELKRSVHSQYMCIQEALFMAFFPLILLLSFLISTLEGFKVTNLCPSGSKEATSLKLAVSMSHLNFTAGKHNFPTAAAHSVEYAWYESVSPI